MDDSGYAHFLLDAVSSDVGYVIGMNLPEEAQNARIPDELAEAYGGVKNLDTMTYEVTGRSSSWGMDLGQVMGILAVVMLVLIIVVGILMFTLNKRKLRKGYVPDWEDDEPD